MAKPSINSFPHCNFTNSDIINRGKKNFLMFHHIFKLHSHKYDNNNFTLGMRGVSLWQQILDFLNNNNNNNNNNDNNNNNKNNSDNNAHYNTYHF